MLNIMSSDGYFSGRKKAAKMILSRGEENITLSRAWLMVRLVKNVFLRFLSFYFAMSTVRRVLYFESIEQSA